MTYFNSIKNTLTDTVSILSRTKMRQWVSHLKITVKWNERKKINFLDKKMWDVDDLKLIKATGLQFVVVHSVYGAVHVCCNLTLLFVDKL